MVNPQTLEINDHAQLGLRLKDFIFEKVLSYSTVSPNIYLLGKLGENQAIVHLQKVAFNPPAEKEDSPSLLSGLESVTTLDKNDIYEWAQGWYGSTREADVKIDIICPCTDVHIRKYSTQARRMIQETPELYQRVVKPYIDSFPPSRIQWVYNILEHKKEVEKIVYEDTDPETGFLIAPDMKWDGKTMSALYLTAIVHNRSLKSLRDLRPQHLSLLNKIKQAAEDIVQEKYGLERNGIRLFLHYQPSYYHLHVHIVSLSNEGFVGAEVGKAHLLQDVISLLEVSDPSAQESILQKMTLSYTLGEQDGLYKAIVASGQA